MSSDARSILATAREAFRAGRNDEALELYERLAKVSTGEEGRDRRIEALDGMAAVHHRRGAYEQVFATCERIREASEAPLHQAMAAHRAAMACYQQSRRDEMVGYFAHAIAAGRSAGEPGREILAQVLCDEANRLCRAGEVDQSMEYLHEVRRIVGTDRGAHRLLVAADIVEGGVARRAGDFRRAVRLFARSEAGAEELGQTELWVMASTGLGTIRQRLGDLERAERHFERAKRRAEDIGNREQAAGCSVQLGNVYWAQWELDKARACNEAALATWEELGNVASVALARANLARLAIHEEDWSQASEGARAALAILERGLNENLRGAVLCDLGRALIELGELEEAGGTFEEVLGEFEEQKHPHVVARAWRGQGRLALLAEDVERACNLLRDGVALLTRIRDEAGAANTRVHLVEALVAAERIPDARFEFSRAREHFELLESKPDLERLAALESRLLRTGGETSGG